MFAKTGVREAMWTDSTQAGGSGLIPGVGDLITRQYILPNWVYYILQKSKISLTFSKCVGILDVLDRWFTSTFILQIYYVSHNKVLLISNIEAGSGK